MRFLVEYYPAMHDFRVHEVPNGIPFKLLDRITTYIRSRDAYNFKCNTMLMDGDLFPYNNSWWLMIEAKSVQQAIRIFWKKMKEYKARSLLKRMEENSHYGL